MLNKLCLCNTNAAWTAIKKKKKWLKYLAMKDDLDLGTTEKVLP